MPVIETWVAPDIECPGYRDQEGWGWVQLCVIPPKFNPDAVFCQGQPIVFEFHYHNIPYPKKESLDVTPILKSTRLKAYLKNGGRDLHEVELFAYLDDPVIIQPGYYYAATFELGLALSTDEIGKYAVDWETPESRKSHFNFEIQSPAVYYPYLLDRNIPPEQWGLSFYGETGEVSDGLAEKVIALDGSIISHLIPLLDNKKAYESSYLADSNYPYKIYQWRVCDFAGIILTEIWGQPPGALRSQDPAERDKRLAELQAYYRLHEQEFKE